MRYYSINDPSHFSNFQNAVLRGIAPDRGLYFPERIPRLSSDFLQNLSNLGKVEIAFEVIKPYVGDEIDDLALKKIIDDTLDFDFPVVEIEEGIGSLELYHGPTLAFKDVGARFMAGSLGYFIEKGNIGDITVLVATSGDTGGAVANGFLGVNGINVVILYPQGKVSEIQEKQLTTMGNNITALEVNGAFDDCQRMVKQAFLDSDISRKRRLTSANSINLARWLPQMFYYFMAYQQLQRHERLVFSVPSGNFGNICAGLTAREMGLPIDHFVAATNVNDSVARYLKTGNYQTRKTVQTISNAMDVGDPSNFDRILELYDGEYENVIKNLSAYSFDDSETRKAIKDSFKRSGYIMDPHGAVGKLGLEEFLSRNESYYGVFLETAHPVKFLDTVEEVIEEKIELPNSIKTIISKQKKSLQISRYEDLKGYLLE